MILIWILYFEIVFTATLVRAVGRRIPHKIRKDKFYISYSNKLFTYMRKYLKSHHFLFNVTSEKFISVVKICLELGLDNFTSGCTFWFSRTAHQVDANGSCKYWKQYKQAVIPSMPVSHEYFLERSEADVDGK